MQQAHVIPQWTAAALAALGLLGGCTDQAEPADSPVVVVVVAIEAPLPGAAPVIRYRIENASSRTVFILACGEQLVAELEQHRGTWKPAEAAIRCQANLPYLPMALRPVTAGEGQVTAPAAGTYRLLVRYWIEDAEGRSQTAVSGPIEVVIS